jgi:hypothetical protein
MEKGRVGLENYISAISGLATRPDTEADCAFYD